MVSNLIKQRLGGIAPRKFCWNTSGKSISFDVCAIEVLYAEAIDGMRFVFADGSYIDTGRVGGSSEAFYVPENHVITTLSTQFTIALTGLLTRRCRGL